MDMSDDWADDSDIPEHVPAKDDRIWSHPSEYEGPRARQYRRFAAILSGIGLILAGLIITKTVYSTTKTAGEAKPASTLSIGASTSNHINQLAKAIVDIVVLGKPSSMIYGLAISPGGYILVPSNLIGQNTTFEVTTVGAAPVKAQLVANDPATDTAVLKLPKSLSDYISGTSHRSTSAGEMTIGIEPSSTAGKPNLVISQIQQTGMEQILSGGQTAGNTFLADPAQKLNPQGLLFVDSHGNPLGLGLGTISNKWVIAPLSEMLAAAQKIELQNGAPQGWLGIVGISAPEAPAQGGTKAAQGVIVYSVVKNSPAYKAGIQPNDNIVALDSVPVTNLQQLQTMLTQYPSGSVVTLTVVRQNETLDETIQLGVKSQG